MEKKQIRDTPTTSLGDTILHYTCNPPKDDKLKHNGIKKVGDQFGIEAREYLLIPKKLFKKLGLFHRTSEEAQINSEKILKLLTSKQK